MIVELSSTVKRRISAYILIFILLVFARMGLQTAVWEESGHLFLAEMLAAVLALFIGTLALIRFYSKPYGKFLFIGLGFIGAGLFDGYLSFFAGTALYDLFPPFSNEPSPWLWNASTLFLSLLIAIGWWWWWRGQVNSLPSQKSGGRLLFRYLSVIAGIAGILTFIFLMRTHSDIAVGLPKQIEIVTASTLFTFALAGYFTKKQWMQDSFEHWLLVSLLIFTVTHLLFLPYSITYFDKMFTVAILFKQVGYACVLFGLLQNIVATFQQTDHMAVKLTKTNAILEREIEDRKRVEIAESEQRELAEALREVGIALSATLDFDELLDCLLDQIARVLPYDTANIMRVNEDQIDIVCTRGYDQSTRLPYTERFPIINMPSLVQMVESKQPVIIPDTAVYPLWVSAEASPHVRSWAGAPITVQGEIVAFLALNNSHPDFYKPSDVERLVTFAGQAAIAMQNAQLYELLQKRIDEQITLNLISNAVTSTLDLQKSLTIITDETTRLLAVDATSVVLVDEEKEDLYFAVASGEASEFVIDKRLAMGQGILGWVAQHGEPLLVADVEADNRHFGDFDEESGFKARSILCVPLQTKGQTIGAIEAINKEDGPFTEDDLRLLNLLARPIASAIENAQLYEKAQQEIGQRIHVEEALEAERTLLARRVEERTADLSTANAELARAARLKDEFLASISHELRTPLNAILGISEALQEFVYGPLNEKQNGSLHSIEESGRHLLSLINDILDLSKVEAGKLELEIRPVAIEAVCNASLRLIKENAHKKRLSISTKFDANINTVQADERRVKQILVNLLSNAVKFTLEGGEIGLEVTADSAAKLAHFTVWDTGIGISKENIGKLFRPFVQLDSRLSREYAGTGLGLSLVYRMVELHGGSVSVESELGKGSRFTISFPWQETGGLFDPIAEAELVAANAPHLSGFRRALLVDDSPATIAQLIRYLGELGMETMTSMQAHGVWEKALVEQPDVILLDILLPDKSGWDVLMQLKAEPPTRNIPVLIISVVEEQAKAMELGASATLVKPINRQQLQSALRQLLINRINNERAMIMATNQKHASFDQPLILLAEDNEANVQTFSDYLRAKQYRILLARDGIEAVEMAKAAVPDLILMDIQLPSMNGLDAIREIRMDKHLMHTPIIAVTALVMDGDREACILAGANAYMSKPVRLRDLVEVIEQQLKEPTAGIVYNE